MSFARACYEIYDISDPAFHTTYKLELFGQLIFRVMMCTRYMICTRGRTLRVPAKNEYPPNIGARALPHPPGNAILTTGYPGTHFFAGYPANCLKFFLIISVPQRMKFKWRIVCNTAVFLPKRRVQPSVSMIDSIHKPPELALPCMTSLRWRDTERVKIRYDRGDG